MSGKVLRPVEWYNRKLNYNHTLNNYPNQLISLKNFINFLQNNNLYMSVIGDGRDTINSSIYTSNSTDKAYWLCDIKFFDGAGFANDVEIVGKEQMNVVGEIYENQEFSTILEILTNKSMQLGKYSNIKTQITINGFNNALRTLEMAIKIYKVFK